MDTSQTWLITGASRGLGRAITTAALDAGHRVVATVRGDHDLPEHERLTVETLDVRDRPASLALADRHEIDVLVNNAGFGLIGAIEEIDEAAAREIIDTDLLGAVWTTQAVLPGMRERGSGHIVQVSTVGAVGTVPTLGLYNAAKWGLEGFSAALAAEVSGLGIRVTIVEPGELDTEWATGSMRFAEPLAAYDELRTTVFGSPAYARSTGTGGGTSPSEAAAAIVAHVADPRDARLRLLVGDDAPGHIAAALSMRLDDYRLDERFRAAEQEL